MFSCSSWPGYTNPFYWPVLYPNHFVSIRNRQRPWYEKIVTGSYTKKPYGMFFWPDENNSQVLDYHKKPELSKPLEDEKRKKPAGNNNSKVKNSILCCV